MNVIDRANAAPLDPELMKDMLTCLAEMPEEQRADMTGRGLGLIRFLEDRVRGDGSMDLASILIAFEFRMEAMVRLREHPQYGAWAVRANRQRDPDLLNEVMLEVAASEPLIERDNRPAFEPYSFFQRALEIAESEGRA
jgi:hypothetical protein